MKKRGRPRKPDGQKWQPTYTPKERGVRETAVQLRGVKLYQYDSEDRAYIGMFDCIADFCDEYPDIPHSTVSNRTRRYPEGCLFGDLFVSRIKLH